jgi:VCBS repeat-containing protein
MENDLIFGTETSDMLTGSAAGDGVQIAAAPSGGEPFADALTLPLDAAQVVIPEGENIVRVPVTPGEVVELPFPSDAQFLAREDNGNLAIKVGDITVILQGYVDAAGQTPPVIEASNGQALDIATILASTDPNIDIQTAAGPAAGPQGADNTGAILTQFGEGAGLGGFTGAGALDGTEGPGNGPVDQTGTLFVLFGATTGATPLVNTAPTALDENRTTDEDSKILNGTVTATDPEGDPLTYSVVGALPAGVTFDPATGNWTFDPAGNYEALNVGDKSQVSFQYKVNDGTSDSNVATVTIDINGVNDNPVFKGGQVGNSNVPRSEDDADTSQTLNWNIVDVDDTKFTITVDPTTLPPGVTYDAVNGKLIWQTAGHYDYLADGEIENFVIKFTITDAHGGSIEQDYTLTMVGKADASDAVNDVLLANIGINSGALLPEWALLANDKDASAEHIVALDGTFIGLSSEGVGGGQWAFTDNGTLGGMGGVKLADGSTSTVDIHNQQGGDLTGTTAHEIIVSGAAGDKIDGQGGKDVIFGQGGDDTVIFHNGDIVNGDDDSIAKSNGFATSANRGDVLVVDHDVNFVNTNITHSGGIETISTTAADGGAGKQTVVLGAHEVNTLSDHTITGVFAEERAIKIDGDAVDQLYLSISKDPAAGGGWVDTGQDVNGYHVFAHETTAGNIATTDAYVMVQAANVANVHLNQDPT